MKDYVFSIEKAFKEYGEGKVQMPSKLYLYFEKGDFRCMPVYIPSMKLAGVKNVNVHPQNYDLPVVMATITLIDPDTGFPLAIMDGTYITKMRTGAAGGVAAKYLSGQDAATASLIGAGEQADAQLQALLVVRPKIKQLRIFDVNRKKMKNFAIMTKDKFNLDVHCFNSVKEAVSDSDIIITTTPAREPLIKADYVSKGAHINAIGADARGKQEIDSALLTNSKIIIDNWDQASHSGEINVSISKGIISRDDIHADIGEIVTGKKAGRESSDEVTIFDSTGLAIQDIYVAGEIYRKLINDKKLEEELLSIDFLK